MPKSRKPAKQEKPASTPETSKPSLRIEIHPDLLEHFRSLGREERRLIGLAIDLAPKAWGQPHLHAGTGIRRLIGDHFECRSGLQTRLVLKALEGGVLYFHLIGNHNDVRRFLKSL